MFFLSIQSSRLPMTNVCDVKTVYIRRLYDSLFENYQLRNTYRFTQQGIISFGKWAEMDQRVIIKKFLRVHRFDRSDYCGNKPFR